MELESLRDQDESTELETIIERTRQSLEEMEGSKNRMLTRESGGGPSGGFSTWSSKNVCDPGECGPSDLEIQNFENDRHLWKLCSTAVRRWPQKKRQIREALRQ